MGLVNGKDVILTILGPSMDDYEVIGCARSVTFDISTEFIETSISGNGKFKTFVPSMKECKGTIEGLTFIQKEITDKVDIGALYDLIKAGTQFGVRYYETDISNTFFLQKQLSCYIESITETASFDNMTTFSMNIKINGEPTFTYGEV